MVNLWKSAIVNRTILYSTICFFTSASIMPLHGIQQNNQININLNDINFGIKIEKLIEKTKKYFKAKDSNKLMKVMFDIKQEIERYTGQKIDMDKSFNYVEKKAKSMGQKIDKNHLKVLKSRFKNYEKRIYTKAIMNRYVELNTHYNADEELPFYENFIGTSTDYVIAKSNYVKDKDEEVVLPLRFTIGVTMTLVGLFLYVVPNPICKATAPWVMDTGLAFLADQAVTEWENKKKEDKK